jgi:hypothetical protein
MTPAGMRCVRGSNLSRATLAALLAAQRSDSTLPFSAFVPGPGGVMSTAVRGTALAEVTCRRIGEAHAGNHVWVPDEGWGYAVKAGPLARGWAATVDAPGPVELEQAVRAAEEAA